MNRPSAQDIQKICQTSGSDPDYNAGPTNPRHDVSGSFAIVGGMRCNECHSSFCIPLFRTIVNAPEAELTPRQTLQCGREGAPGDTNTVGYLNILSAPNSNLFCNFLLCYEHSTHPLVPLKFNRKISTEYMMISSKDRP